MPPGLQAAKVWPLKAGGNKSFFASFFSKKEVLTYPHLAG
jgi:hypothetical protein